MESKKQFMKTVFFTLIATVLSFFLVEGFLSTIIVIRDFINPTSNEIERIHTKYDSLLGWINLPNHEVKNLYGPGIYLKTNSQSFRNEKDFSVNIPKDKVRIVCSGDSFTLGFGVNNEHTWCQQLVSVDNHLETANLGQGGYGVDQSYLRYMRDGKKLNHNIHIFAFIADDFRRMTTDKLWDKYSKPVLKIINGKLSINNIPVPRRSYLLPQPLEKFGNLRTYEFFKRIANKINSKNKSEKILHDEKETKEIVLKVFDDLQIESKKLRGGGLLLVLLPTNDEYLEYQLVINKWREWLKKELPERGILYIDLCDEFLKLPFGEVSSLFLRDGHYSEKGNKYVAELIYKKLLSYGLLDSAYEDKH